MNTKHHITLASTVRRPAILAAALLALFGATAGLATAAEPAVRGQLQEMLLTLSQTGVISGSAPISVSEPERAVRNLGVVFDPHADAQQGIAVLAVTPGSAGQQAGLRSGDLLRTVNGVALHDLHGPPTTAARTLGQVMQDSSGDAFTFTVRRGAREHELQATIQRTQVPAATLLIGAQGDIATAEGVLPGGCGRISTVDVAPRQDDLHRARLQLVDGRNAGTAGQDVFRLPAGLHKLTIAENIDAAYLAMNERQRSRSVTTKTLLVNIEPDQVYFVAAWLDEQNRHDWSGGGYWQPVVWKISAQRCR